MSNNSSDIRDFSLENINEIGKLFNSSPVEEDGSFSLRITGEKINRLISLNIFPDNNNFLISVYSENSHLQLQSCKGFIISNLLEEVIFFSECSDCVSGLIISKKGDCSLYSSIDKSLFKKNFMELNSEKLLSAVALSVIESGLSKDN